MMIRPGGPLQERNIEFTAQQIVNYGKKTLQQKLDELAARTGGRTKPEDDSKEEQRMRGMIQER